MIRFTEKEIKEIKYVVVEVSLKSDATNKTRGLLLGCQPMVKTDTQLVSKGEEYIWLYRGNNVHMLNVADYKINLLEIEKDFITSTHTVGKDHEEYIKRIKLIQKVFADEKKVLNNGLIDADKYTVPQKVAIELGKPITKPVTRTAVGYTGPYTGSGYNYKKKESSTANIERTTKYPVEEAINRMKLKVEELRQDKYEAPKLADMKGTDEAKKDATNTTDESDDDDDLYNSYFA